MKRKILVPMFASFMALSMNTTVNADEVKEDKVEKTDDNKDNILELGKYEKVSYKKAVVKDGVAVKIREEGDVQLVAYSGHELKVKGSQGDWLNVESKLENSDETVEGWIPARYVETEAAPAYATNVVNFREKANTDSKIIEELEIADSVKVIEDKGEWIKVKKGDKEGYIHSDFLSDEKPVIEVEEVVEAPQEAQTSTNQSSNNNNNNNSSNTSNNDSTSASKPDKKPAENNNANPPASSSAKVQAVLNLAYSKLGSPYVWGAEGPNSFDCSGLTSYVYRNAAGVSLPRSSSAQAGFGQTVSRSNLKAGDLVFFTTNGTGGVSHVGIYVGGGDMIHCPRPGKTVEVVSINSDYYASRFVTAKRVL